MANKSTAKAKPTTVVTSDQAAKPGRLKHVGGSRSDDWNNVLANQTINTLWVKNSDQETRSKQVSAAVAALVGIGPKDELEAMAAGQLVAAHNAAMECYRRAMIGEQTFEGRRENLAQANKLSRTYAVLWESLNRHRGKGQQKVTVEHVNVHAGGQAIVGAVSHSDRHPGGETGEKREEQPHAKQIGHAPRPPMRCQEEGRDIVPIASDGEWSVPYARGQVRGTSTR